MGVTVHVGVGEQAQFFEFEPDGEAAAGERDADWVSPYRLAQSEYAHGEVVAFVSVHDIRDYSAISGVTSGSKNPPGRVRSLRLSTLQAPD
jgi:hypothetical protein